jgi:hypothetical protein
MKLPRRERRSHQPPAALPRAGRDGHLAAGLRLAIGGGVRLLAFAGGTARATGSGAADTTSALQALPDSTLRGLAAGSVGLGTGFFLAGKPRLVVAAGIVPALLAAAAIIVRPIQATAPATIELAVPRRGWRVLFRRSR